MVIPEQTLIAVLVAFAASAALTPMMRKLAERRSWIDEPNHRSSHTNPIPRVGGVAFIVATLIGVGIGTAQLEWWMLGIGLGAVLVAVAGWRDDIQPLGVVAKFASQGAAAVLAVLLLEPRILIELPFRSATLSPLASGVLAVIWIIAVVNAFNFLDGLDGLAAGVALVTAAALAGMVPGSAPLLMPFAAAIGGFLLWNTDPASIFMGDVGSQFVGYLLATAVLMPGPTDTGAVPVLFVFAPVLGDAAVTIARRLVRGSSPFAADRNHVFHGLAAMGITHRAVAIRYMLLTALGGVAGLAYLDSAPVWQTVLLLAAVASMGLLGVRLVLFPPQALAPEPSRGKLTNG
jgi:UDP-GlcNAc:undecaprenyl-phosphate GlcNAc-1-phosphate transferase